MTYEKIREVAALHTQVLGVCRAATNEGVFTPELITHVLCSNDPLLPVRLDYSSVDCRTYTLSRHIRRITVWLHDFSRRLGNSGDQRYCSGSPLDDLLQTSGTRQRPDATVVTSFVRGGQQRIAD